MEHVNVKYSPNATGVAIYDTSGRYFFTCSFSNNTVDNKIGSETSDGVVNLGGGGILIKVGSRSCKPGSLLYPELSSSNTFVGTTYTFSICVFEGNKVGNAEDRDFLFPFNFEHRGEGCGGGLSLILKDTASEIIFKMENSIFENNVALNGGAIFIVLNGNIYGNIIQIENTLFRSNNCPYIEQSVTAGGAIQFYKYLPLYTNDTMLPSDSNRNELVINNSTFIEYWALKGGGISVTWPLINTLLKKLLHSTSQAIFSR